jgi:hypothetical protein
MKDVVVAVRMTAELRDRLADLAAAKHRTLSSQIAWMLSQEAPTKPVEPRQTMEIPNGVSEQTWADFRKLRVAKKAPITPRALEGIWKEADKAGYTLEAALRECCARGWTGFKADWVKGKNDDVAALLRPSVPQLEM